MALKRNNKTQQRRRSKVEIEQFCCLLAKQIVNTFGVHPAIIIFPKYEGQKIKSVNLTISSSRPETETRGLNYREL